MSYAHYSNRSQPPSIANSSALNQSINQSASWIIPANATSRPVEFISKKLQIYPDNPFIHARWDCCSELVSPRIDNAGEITITTATKSCPKSYRNGRMVYHCQEEWNTSSSYLSVTRQRIDEFPDNAVSSPATARAGSERRHNKISPTKAFRSGQRVE